MILGVGVDLVELEGFARQLGDEASVFAEKVFTTAERRDARARAQRASGDEVRHLAARYAAKEAFLKAWSGAHTGAPRVKSVELRELEVRADAWGRPRIVVHGALAEALRAEYGEGWRAHLSLTHEGAMAAAYVTLERV